MSERFVAVRVTGYSEGSRRPGDSWSVLDRAYCYQEVERFYGTMQRHLPHVRREKLALECAQRLNETHGTPDFIALSTARRQ